MFRVFFAPVAVLRNKQAFLDGFLVLFRRVINMLADRAFELDHVVLWHKNEMKLT